MRRTGFVSIGFLFGSLFLASPVSAISYSATVAFDLASLSFSGIPVSFSTVIPPGTFDPFLNDTTAEQRNTFIQARTAVSSHAILSPNWQNGAVTDHIAGVGSVTAFATPVSLSSSIDLRSSGQGSSLMSRAALLTATQAGSLTVSINYSISHSGVIIGDPDFSSVGRAGLTLGNVFDVNQQRDFRDLFLGGVPPVDAPMQQGGTASVTYLFNAGQSVPLSMFTTISATVPLPDMLWPTLVGMVGLAIFAEGKRQLKRVPL